MSDYGYSYDSYNTGSFSENIQPQNEQPEKQGKEPKKKKGLFKRTMISLFTGLVFGAFAAVGFIGVQKANDYVSGKQEALQKEVEGAVVSKETTSETTAETAKQEITTTLNTSGVKQPASYQSSTVGGSVEAVVEEVMPSMVAISKTYYQSYSDYVGGYGFFFGGGSQETKMEAQAQGSGIIIGETDDEFLIVSNNHVVEDPISLSVTFVDDSTATAYIKGLDSSRDLAVISVQKKDLSTETLNAISVAKIGDSDALKLGEQVVAIGNALGYGQSVTTGIVSALDRVISTEDGEENTFIQTDTAINAGNSGGALLNMNGEVIGINSVKIASSSVEGMGYAIPISQVGDILSDLMLQTTKIKVEEENAGYLGISGQDVTETLAQRYSMPVGIYVVETVEGSGAQQAGLQAGDIIVKFDGSTVKSFDDLKNLLQYYSAGTTVSVSFKRMTEGQYETYTVDLTLGAKPTTE